MELFAVTELAFVLSSSAQCSSETALNIGALVFSENLRKPSEARLPLRGFDNCDRNVTLEAGVTRRVGCSLVI